MLIKNRISLVALMVALPIMLVLISIDSFFVLMSILILLISGKSLRQLYVLNFGSDAAFEAMELRASRRQMNEKDRQLNRMMVFLLNLLFIIFFAYTYFAIDNVFIRIAAGITAANWIYDMARTFIPHKVAVDNNEEWTIKDTLAEIFLWFHNILTIAVVAVTFAVKFL